MSQTNVEAVQRLLAGFNRRDDDWQAVLAELDSDIEIVDLDISLDAERFRGHNGVRKWLAMWSDAWENWRIEDLDARPVDVERVIAFCVMVVTGKESGIELSRSDAMVCDLRAGKIAALTYYNDREQALEALGLSEQDARADS